MAFSLGGSNGTRGRRRFGGSSGTLSEINIIPLVDVVLVLLVIFMLTAHVMEFGLEVNVPETKLTQESAQDLPIISMSADGRLALNEKSVKLAQIPEELKKRFKNAQSVYVRCDKDLVWGTMAQLVSELKAQKIQIMLVTKPIESGGKR
jgi:biopolymer transport protein ExbD